MSLSLIILLQRVLYISLYKIQKMEFNRNWQKNPTFLTKVFLKLHKRMQNFTYCQNNPSPELFFVLYFIQFLGLNLVADDIVTHQSILIIGIIIMLYHNANYYFYYICFLKMDGSWFIAVKIFLGLLACNEKWKIYIFVFALNNDFSKYFVQFESSYQTTVSLFIVYRIYSELIFSNLNDNVKYFVGFSTIFFMHTIKLIINDALRVQLPLSISLMELIILGLLSYVIIKHRIKQIIQQPIDKIKSPYFLRHHIQMLRVSPYFIQDHLQQCSKVSCFCRKIKEAKEKNDANRSYQRIHAMNNARKIVEKELVNEIYTKILRKNRNNQDDKVFILHRYIEFLLQNKYKVPIIKLLNSYTKQYLSYFIKVQRYRIQQRLRKECEKLNYFDPLRKRYIHIYDYDLMMGYINKQIREIISQKIQFWKEIGYPITSLKKIQRIGRNLVHKIENLHEFYCYKMRPNQQSTLNFNCTIMYSTYLLLTTNNINYANTLLKKAQDITNQIGPQVPIDIYGLQTTIEQQTHHNKYSKIFLKIINVSGSLAQILSHSKKQLINQQITEIIPPKFRQTHNVAFMKCTKPIQFTANRQYSVMYQTIQLPFYIGDKQIAFMKMNNRIRIDLYNHRVCFQSIIYKNQNSSCSLLIDLQKQVVMQEKNTQSFNMLKNKKICKYVDQFIKNIKQAPKQNHIGNLHKFANIQLSSGIHHLSLTLPFFNNLIKIREDPVIRVKLENQNIKSDRVLCNISTGIEKTLQPNYALDNDSRDSLSSRKDTIQNVILMLQKQNWLKQQKFVVLFFIFVFLTGFSSIFIKETIQNSNGFSKQFQQQSFMTLNTIFQSNILISETINWQIDRTLYRRHKDGDFGQTIKNLYKQSDYEQICQTVFERFFNILFLKVKQNFLGKVNIVNTLRQQFFKQNLYVPNPNNIQSFRPINMSIQDILMNMLTDIKFLKYNSYQQTVISRIYISKVANKLLQFIENAEQILEKRIAEINRNNIIALILVSITFILLIVPFWKLTVANKNKHLGVYSALVALGPELIRSEITKLQQIDQKVFNYRYTYARNMRQKTNQFMIKDKTQLDTNHQSKDPVQILAKYAVQQIDNIQKQKQSINYQYYKMMRTRAGELKIQGSECDKKIIRKMDYFLLLFIVIFISWVVFIYIEKKNRIDALIQQKENSFKILQDLQTDTFQLMATKMFFNAQKNETEGLTFMGKNLQSWLYQSVKQQITNQNLVQYNDNYVKIQQCSENFKVCTLSYSVSLLRGIIKKVIYHSFIWKKTILSYDQNQLQGITEYQMRLGLFFSQQVQRQIYIIQSQQLQNQQKEFQEYSKFIESQLHLLTNLFLLVLIMFLVYSWFYLFKNKKLFTENVTILSFLNKDMLYKNKQIQSFIQRLSKELR